MRWFSIINKFLSFIFAFGFVLGAHAAEDQKSGCAGMLVGKDQKPYSAEIEEAKSLMKSVCTDGENAYLLKTTQARNKGTLEKCVHDYGEFKTKMADLQKLCGFFDSQVKSAEQACRKQAATAGKVTENIEAAKVGTAESKSAEDLHALAKAYGTRALSNTILGSEVEGVARRIEKRFGVNKEEKALDLPQAKAYLQEQKNFARSKGNICIRPKNFFDKIWIGMRDNVFPAFQKLREASLAVSEAAKKSVPEDKQQAASLRESAENLKTASGSAPVAADPASSTVTAAGTPKILDSEYQKSQRVGGAKAAEPAPKEEQAAPPPAQTLEVKPAAEEQASAVAATTPSAPAVDENPHINPTTQEIMALRDAAPPWMSASYNWPEKSGYRRAGYYVLENRVYQVWVDANGKKMSLPK